LQQKTIQHHYLNFIFVRPLLLLALSFYDPLEKPEKVKEQKPEEEKTIESRKG
jgi:hypothetical protein